MNGKSFIIVICIFIFSEACTYQFPEEKIPTSEDFGDLNTEQVIALGDDYFAGVMDGALYTAGQENSIPALIVNQINKIQPIQFNQPEIDSENGYNLYQSGEEQIFGKWIYQYKSLNSDSPVLMLTQGEPVKSFEGDRSSLSNFSIPNLYITKLNKPSLSTNPFYQRIAREPGESNLFSDIIETNPTFALIWIGMNDFLGYSITGGVKGEYSGYDDWQLPAELTSIDTFSKILNELIEGLLQNPECKIAIGNLISIQSLPFFYIRPYNQLFLTNTQLGPARERYQQFNLAVAEYNRTVPSEKQRPFIDFYDNGWNLHPQPMVVLDNSLPDATYPDGRALEKFRQLSKLEMVLYSVTNEMIEQGYGSLFPLSEEFYLSGDKIIEIEQNIADFNSIIRRATEMNQDRIVLVDVASKAGEIANTGKTDAWGDPLNNEIIYSEGVPVEGSLGMNSIFSLDGLHFNSRGNAFAANEFIRAINQHFHAKIPLLSINNYKGNTYTATF